MSWRLRLYRTSFLWGLPVVIAFHWATSRSEVAVLRGSGLALMILYLLLFTLLAHAPCPRCGAPFFGDWLSAVWGPWRIFRRRPTCGACGASLRGQPRRHA